MLTTYHITSELCHWLQSCDIDSDRWFWNRLACSCHKNSIW